MPQRCPARHRRRRVAASLVGALASAACRDDTAPAPTPAALEVVEGDQQQAAVGTAVPIAPKVVARDAEGKVIAGVPIVFRLTIGEGATLRDSTATTGADGTARLGAWVLGPRVIPYYSVEACTRGAPAGRVVCRSFYAAAVPGPAAVIRVMNGDGRSALTGSRFALALAVEDRFGNAVCGNPLNLRPAPARPTVTLTPTQGDSAELDCFRELATLTWTLSHTPGPRSLTVRVGEASATLTATALLPPYTIEVLEGAGQRRLMLDTADGPAVRVMGTDGTPRAGVLVRFAIRAGEGRLVQPAELLLLGQRPDTALLVRTDAGGVARVSGWVLGPTPGAQTVVAEVEGLAPLAITATALGTLVPLRAVAISATHVTSCALDVGGQAYCWGDNIDGGLGAGIAEGAFQSGTRRASARPILVDAPPFAPAAMALASGPRTTCALDAAGVPWCWGRDLFDLTTTGAGRLLRPVAVRGGLPLATLAVGSRGACGLTRDGTGACWGADGALVGEGAGVPRRAPVPLANRPALTDVGAGCAVTSGQAVLCWGTIPDSGAPPPPNTVIRTVATPVPVLVATGTPVVRLAVGWTSFSPDVPQPTFGLTPDGRVAHWAGDGTRRGAVEDDLAGTPRFVSLAAGANRLACGLTADGTAYCRNVPALHGANDVGERWSRVAGEVRFRRLAAGGGHVCGIALDGVVWCWGSGDDAALGWGIERASATPRQVVLRVDP